MKKIDKHIEIVSSSSSRLSSMSRVSREAIKKVLKKHYRDVRISMIDTPADLEALINRAPDLVFLGMKFIPINIELSINDPEKIWISDQLDLHGIAYTGSSSSSHKLELNKNLAKQRILDEGLKTARFTVISQDQVFGAEDINLRYPVFIKPSNRGGGLGIDSQSVAHNFEQAKAKIVSIIDKYQSDVLVEEYLSGREFSVALMKSEQENDYEVMPLELVADANDRGDRVLGMDTKSANAEQVLAVTDKAARSSVVTLARDVFFALGARDYGRIDIRMDAAGVPHFLEANLIPSLIENYGSFPKACELNIGVGYEAMIANITNLAFARSLNDGLIADDHQSTSPLEDTPAVALSAL